MGIGVRSKVIGNSLVPKLAIPDTGSYSTVELTTVESEWNILMR